MDEPVDESLACYSIRYFSNLFRFYTAITFEIDIRSQYRPELSNRSYMDEEKTSHPYSKPRFREASQC